MAKPGTKRNPSSTCKISPPVPPSSRHHGPSGTSSSQGIFSFPEFPRTKDLRLPHTVPADKVNTFLTMYTVHSQQVYSAIVSFNYSEVSIIMQQFWSSVP